MVQWTSVITLDLCTLKYGTMEYRTLKIGHNGLVYLEKRVQYTILTILTSAVHLQYVKYKVQWTSIIGKYGRMD